MQKRLLLLGENDCIFQFFPALEIMYVFCSQTPEHLVNYKLFFLGGLRNFFTCVFLLWDVLTFLDTVPAEKINCDQNRSITFVFWGRRLWGQKSPYYRYLRKDGHEFFLLVDVYSERLAYISLGIFLVLLFLCVTETVSIARCQLLICISFCHQN